MPQLVRIIIVAAAILLGELGASAQTIEPITMPSQDVILSFVMPGRIDSIPVKQGDRVKTGDLLIKLDDAAEQASAEQLKRQAEDTIKIRYAEAQFDLKKVMLEKMEAAQQKSVATEIEVAQARLEAKSADLSLELARFEKTQAELKYKEVTATLKRMSLLSPFDGLVERINAQPGESADRDVKIMRVVKIDPLYIDAPVSRQQSSRLRLEQAVKVGFHDDSAQQTGKIIFIASVADAGSDTVTVRVELPNPSLRRAGERVSIDFGPEGVATTATAPVDTLGSRNPKEE